MLVYPSNITALLRFDAILEVLKQYCHSEIGIRRLETQPWIHDKFLLEKELRKVVEFKNIFTFDIPFPALSCHDLTINFEHIHIENSYLDIEVFLKIKDNASAIESIVKFFKDRTDKQEFPYLESIVRSAFFDRKIIQLVDQVIDEKGAVKSNSSKELAEIRQAIHSKNRQIERAYQIAYKELSAKGYLTDTEETIRNGRRVFAVFAEHKRGVSGIIHDESDTGKTTYIEPELVIFLNNQLSELERDEQREIRKILIQLTAQMRAYASLILSYQVILAEFDYVRAKGKMAFEMDAFLPILSESKIQLQHAYHPLLKLLQRATKKQTVPFNVTLDGDKHVLLISGPNAGGKSVTMNAIGLMSMMLQKGMLIPCEANSSMMLFHHIFADVGDAQSIEDELSTYSSRLKHMNFFLAHADRQTLVLIDEMGSGTDPLFGGAIAEAVLNELIERKSYAVVTTHFGNLKTFGDKHPSILNGCMLFDETNLSPTYQLSLGKPGSSYTFEIARKSGLGVGLVELAKSSLDQDRVNYDALLNKLEQREIFLNKQIKDLESQQRDLSHQIKKWQRLNSEIELNRKRLQYERMTEKHNITLEKNKQLNEFIQDIRRTDKELLKLEKKVLEEQVMLQNESLKQMYKSLHQVNHKEPIEVGSKVKYIATETSGIVEKIKDGKAIVTFGHIKSTLPLDDLVLDKEKQSGIGLNKKKIDLAEKAQLSLELDLRGMIKQEAIATLEEYIDRALVTNMYQFRIIHGTGTLKKAVWDTLRSFSQLSKFYHPEREGGGEGATIVMV